MNHYYPYGALMDISTAATQPYKYTGKELDRTHGLDWYDHGARMNDPLTLRWNGVDKRAEEYVHFSPYSVCADNPVKNIDFNGNRIYTVLYKKYGYGAYTYYHSPNKFANAMRIFARTSFGKKIIADFTPKGSSFFGVKGNGKYSDFEFCIQEGDYASTEDEMLVFYNGSTLSQAQSQMNEGENGKA